AGLEQMGGDLERLLPHRGGGEMNGRAGGHGLPAGEAALAIGNDRGIAGRDGDLAGRDAELLGANLRERGADALPPRHGAGADPNAAGAADAHDPRLERAASGALDAVADADAEIAPRAARARLARAEAGMVDRLEREPLVGWEVAAVERDRRAGA